MNVKKINNMSLIERPIHNIKQIDWGAVVWIGVFFVIPMTFWVFPAQARMGLIEAITYLFSLDFYTEPTVSTNIVSGMQNKTYLLLNIGKVILWIWTIIIVLRFLFKKPNEIES
ncbi:TPA: hypothetical protein QCW13_005064 [Bacillus cereus]|nr:hypothetical protein [Bacillus cereus]HDR7020885.1 hypothetical protein [Bacillus cereus]